MYRFLFPAFVMIGAIVVLLAGAVGDFPSLPDMTRDWTAYFANIAPERAAVPTSDGTQAASLPAPTPAAAKPLPTPAAPEYQANQLPASDTLQRQAAELQAQIAQRARELASLHSSEDQVRHELDASHQQRQAEQAALSQLQAQQKQMAATEPHETQAPSHPVSQPVPAPLDNASVQTVPVPPRATTQYARRQTQPAPAPPRHVPPQTAQPQTPQDDLANARELLVSGRAADARQLLVQAQAQSELRPVTPDQPFATGGTVTTARIGEAIRFVDTGNTKYALRAIEMAMGSTTNGTRAWPASPSPTAYGKRYAPGPAH